MTSFGQHGDKEGDLSFPWGVCVDKDGFVYVIIAMQDFVDHLNIIIIIIY